MIPKAFFKELRLDGDAPWMVSTRAGEHKKRAPTGVYDNHIVCEQCEVRFGPWDQAAVETLIQRAGDQKPYFSKGELLAHVLRDYDYKKVKMFFISLLWRAGVSSQGFYASVSLGPFERQARQAILDENAGDSRFFSVFLGRWNASARQQNLAKAMLSPNKNRYGNAIGYRFYLSNYIAEIKCSNSRFPREMEHACLDPDRPLVLLSRSFDESAELRVMRHVAKVVDSALRDGRH